ncbi:MULTISPECIES: site-specific DNA-methyltransferase [unclassified Bradyrhizobium]|uniref:site-specific DNA-methyltransferase n=1 Tax=unclassified Bradyrhizobium TaxID=2631580 RepID=UPI002916404E|nr:MULTISPECIES: site-specific DNA-methyltransferase [unclassified Bradyrhizobium]
MARSPKTPKSTKQVDALKHDAASRKNIPTAEMESFFRRDEDASPLPPKHYRRARPLPEGTTRTPEEPSQPELIWNGMRITISEAQKQELAETGKLTLSDAQLVWRGKDRQDWSDLVVNVPPLYIQEKIHPKAIIDDLKGHTESRREAESDAPDLFADFNGIEPDQRAEFYQHDQHWSNRMILGDSLQVMASLAEREALRGKVQCIYFDPPYGIKFNSNWQVSTQSRDVKDGKQTDISREPEQVKAFRDTWKDGIHSYLAYLRDRLTVMRDLLTESGSIFVQIGDENVHRVRAVMDEVFGESNFVSQIAVMKTAGRSAEYLAGVSDQLVWYARNFLSLKYRKPLVEKGLDDDQANVYRWLETPAGERRRMSDDELSSFHPSKGRVFRLDNFTSQKPPGSFEFELFGQKMRPGKRYWSTGEVGVSRLKKANRLTPSGFSAAYIRYIDDFGAKEIGNVWIDTGTGSFTDDKVYIVQSGTKTVQRCILMSTDPGDLVLDPTCGSGTTAYVSEQWGRRWITVDTSRVALALARTRLMAARYPWYLLADSREGRSKEAELSQRVPADTPVQQDIRQGFVYERVPRIMLGKIANNPDIDDIWNHWQTALEPLRTALNAAMSETWEEWQVPRELPADAPAAAKEPHAKWWEARIARQREIDASIAARAEVEYLYDKPYQDNGRVRVAGPFTVESLSPHRAAPASEEELIDLIDAAAGKRAAGDADLAGQDFAAIVIDYLKTEGVKQQAKGDRISFESLAPWPGNFIGASGSFIEGDNGPERRAAILIGPEYGTVGRQDLVAAAREAVDNRFDVLIACAFNFDAHSSELGSLGSLKILKARINPDMHMSDELKNTGRGNMFVVFGEPDVQILDEGGSEIRVKVNGVDVFDPNTGDIRSNDTKGIAAWFVDTDYNEESFFVRHAYFLGANDPYKSLKTALQADIDEDAWATLYSDTSRPFPRPKSRKIAVKVINHFGDEVMKVFGV